MNTNTLTKLATAELDHVNGGADTLQQEILQSLTPADRQRIAHIALLEKEGKYSITNAEPPGGIGAGFMD